MVAHRTSSHRPRFSLDGQIAPAPASTSIQTVPPLSPPTISAQRYCLFMEEASAPRKYADPSTVASHFQPAPPSPPSRLVELDLQVEPNGCPSMRVVSYSDPRTTAHHSRSLPPLRGVVAAVNGSSAPLLRIPNASLTSTET